MHTFHIRTVHIAIDCGPLSDPENGGVSLRGTTFGSGALYFCNTGFTLTGPSSRLCMANGSWSGEAPVCERECMLNLL